MTRDSRILARLRKKRSNAVSSVIGGVIIFGIVFSTVAGFFIFEMNARTIVEQAGSQRSQLDQIAGKESFVVYPNPANGYLYVRVNDTGPNAIVLASLVVGSSSNSSILYVNQTLNIPINPGPGNSKLFNTGMQYSSGAVWVKVITNHGTTSVGFYPPIGQNSGPINALTAGAIGDIYLTFGTFTYYNATQAGCITGPQYSGWCLKTPGLPGFTIPHGVGSIIFAVNMTDWNAAEKSIVLDQFTLLYEVFPHAASGFPSTPWNIISIDTTNNNILNQYSPVVLNYGIPVTVYFGAIACVSESPGPNLPGNVCKTMQNLGKTPIQCINCIQPAVGSGFDATVFIMAHAWEYSPPVTLNLLTYSQGQPYSSNYAQNLPYVGTIYT